MVDDYRPAEFWSDRLSEIGGLRSTGHASYGEAYNRWLYRRKGIVLDRALRVVGPFNRALDLGSGIGWVVDRLQRAGASHVHGIDISAEAVTHLRERFPEFIFDQVRLGEQPIPIDDGSIDCVTFLDVAYHIVDDGLWERTVAEAARVLRPGGSLVVIDAFGPAEVRPAAHVRFRSAERWHRVARGVGLSPVEQLPCYRWLSRSQGASVLHRLPERIRGAVEFGLDAVAATPSHLSCVVYSRTS